MADSLTDGISVGMPKNGAFLLSEYPGDRVRIRCDRCGRDGRYRRASLVMRYGADIGLPDLLAKIVIGSGCTRRGDASNPCGAYYQELSAK